jgi:hypothetical protein
MRALVAADSSQVEQEAAAETATAKQWVDVQERLQMWALGVDTREEMQALVQWYESGKGWVDVELHASMKRLVGVEDYHLFLWLLREESLPGIAAAKTVRAYVGPAVQLSLLLCGVVAACMNASGCLCRLRCPDGLPWDSMYKISDAIVERADKVMM